MLASISAAPRLSDTIEAGARIMGTRGPRYPYMDCWAALAAGLNGQPVDNYMVCALYGNNPWGITCGSDLEHWLRLAPVQGYDWATIIGKLREHGL
jgi:hypothetical protein